MNKLLLAALLPLLMAGCTTIADKTTLQQQGISTDGMSKVTFHSLRMETSPDGKSIFKGSLGRIGHNPVHFGHLDYTVTDSNGTVLESGKTGYSGEIKRRLPRRPSRFTIPLKQAWQPGSHRIAVVFDGKPHQP